MGRGRDASVSEPPGAQRRSNEKGCSIRLL